VGTMNFVVMYQPIDREFLEELFENPFSAQSFKDLGNHSYSIEVPDRHLPNFKRFGVAHTVINWIDKREIERKLKNH